MVVGFLLLQLDLLDDAEVRRKAIQMELLLFRRCNH